MNNDAATDLVLHQFRASHYNEKVRWALDFKGLAVKRVSHLPGLHMFALKRLSGQTTTPVLRAGAKVITGSAAIIEHLEREFRFPPLYPVNATDRSRALEIQRSWDVGVGRATRTLIYSRLLNQPEFLVALFADSEPALKRGLYRAAMTLLCNVIVKANGGTDANKVAAAHTTIAHSLDWLAANINASGQLITESFTVADLSCAALLTPLVSVTHPAMATPSAAPQSVVELRAQYQDHPAIQWVQEQYTKHRGNTAQGPARHRA